MVRKTKRATIKEQMPLIINFALKFQEKYPSYCPDLEILQESIIRLLWRGFNLSDLMSEKYDGIIVQRYELDEKEVDQRLTNRR